MTTMDSHQDQSQPPNRSIGVARPPSADQPDALLDPDAIAQTYLDVLRQPRNAWSLEVELRPWVENF